MINDYKYNDVGYSDSYGFTWYIKRFFVKLRCKLTAHDFHNYKENGWIVRDCLKCGKRECRMVERGYGSDCWFKY